MRLKLLVGILVFLIVVNLATIGTYLYYRIEQHPAEIRDFPPGAPIPPPLHDLGTIERTKLLKLMMDFHDETMELRDSVRSLEHESYILFQENPVSKDKINAKLQEIAAIRLEISKKAAARFIEAKTFLTQEQAERFFGAIMQARPDGPDGPPPFRGGRPPDPMRDGQPQDGPPPERLSGQ